MAQYLKVSNVKKKAKLLGRRVGKDFVYAMDTWIDLWIEKACGLHNGGKITLDASLAAYSKPKAA